MEAPDLPDGLDALLDPRVPLTRVLDRVRRRWARHQRFEAEICVGLSRLFRDQVHRGSGRSRFSDYVRERTGIPGKLVWVFKNLGDHFERLPLVRRAMEEGTLTYTKAREFAPYIDPEEQEFWIGFAGKHTNRRIEREVARANAKKQGRKYRPKRKLTLRVTGVEHQALRGAREKLSKELKAPLSMDEALPLLAQRALTGGLFGEDGPGGEPDAKGRARKALPYATLCLCPFCATTWVPIPGENLEAGIEEWVANLRAGAELVNLLPEYLCDCGDAKHRRDQCPHREAPSEEEAVRRYLPAAEARKIAARDGYRCRTPGCGSALPIEHGHLGKAYRDGGAMDARRVGHQCATCNTLVENERLFVKGRPPFETYYRADGSFLGYGYDPDPWTRLSHVGDGDDRVRERPPPWATGPFRAA